MQPVIDSLTLLGANPNTPFYSGESMLMGTFFQIFAVGLTIIYAIFAVRYGTMLADFVDTLLHFGRQSESSTRHINPALKNNILLYFSLIVVVEFSLFVVRVATQCYDLPYTPNRLFWIGGGVTILAIIAVVVLQVLISFVCGILSSNHQFFISLLSLRWTYITLVSMLVFPIVIIYCMGSGVCAKIAFVALLVVVAFALCIYIKESLRIFLSHNLSIFVYFLYLCALELFPLSIVVSPLFR